MFLKSLKIESRRSVIREIQFHAGLNLIVDETPTGESPETGNNVGKTTVLKLIDFCLGADSRKIYTDLENPKVEYAEVKSFLLEEQILVTLSLCDRLGQESDRDLVIERNFLPRSKAIRRINGIVFTEDGFDEFLTNHLFSGHFGKKPTFPQIISHNIRYKEPGVSNTLRTLNAFTRDDEYETLYLFLLGVKFDQGDLKQALLAQLRTETTFKGRLESKQTRSAYETSLSLLLDELSALESRKAAFKQTSTLDADITTLGELKYKKSVVAAELARTRLRHSLVSEAVGDIASRRAEVDLKQLSSLYSNVSERLNGITKTFGQLVDFHNRMVDEKRRYIAKELPQLESAISRHEDELRRVLAQEAACAKKIEKSGAVEDFEEVVLQINAHHRQRGELETRIGQLTTVESSIDSIKSQLADIDRALFSEDGVVAIQSQLNKFNRYFSAVSNELYGEKYAMKVDRAKTRTDQPVYRFSCFNTNFSSGKKQGEITCFDIAYTLFADEEEIPCYHFLLNDKKELMHDNQLDRIGKLVSRKSDQVQFVASILRDKLPPTLNRDEFITVKLSQNDKLFRIESGGIDPATEKA